MMQKCAVIFLALALVLAPVPSVFANEGKSAKEGAPAREFEYVQLDAINLPVITTRGLTQQVSLLVSLEVPAAKKDDVAALKPKLADAYLQDLYGALSGGQGLMKDNLINVPVVKARLTAVAERVLGPELKPNDVLLQVVQQRPM